MEWEFFLAHRLCGDQCGFQSVLGDLVFEGRVDPACPDDVARLLSDERFTWPPTQDRGSELKIDLESILSRS